MPSRDRTVEVDRGRADDLAPPVGTPLWSTERGQLGRLVDEPAGFTGPLVRPYETLAAFVPEISDSSCAAFQKLTPQPPVGT